MKDKLLDQAKYTLRDIKLGSLILCNLADHGPILRVVVKKNFQSKTISVGPTRKDVGSQTIGLFQVLDNTDFSR